MATYIIKRGRQKPGNPAVREFSRAPYDDIELFFDYLEIVFQFGYVTMFAVAFPLGAYFWFPSSPDGLLGATLHP
jgi:hypothetical protein